MEGIYYCEFCRNTNTKIEDITTGIWNKKIGEKVVIDKNAGNFYKCVQCRKVFCEKCCERRNAFKKKVEVFSTKRWMECPDCFCDMIKLN